ncbi:MAG: cell wall protein [Myxococcales bacterium]|nr:cell wall protein [Myxococcales bacterium]MDP3501030.1 cell wall protein [Myxococcales bacterium]
MSSVDQLLRNMVQAEVERAIGPLAAALQQQGEVLGRFAAAFGAPIKRGPGRPRKQAFGAVAAPKATRAIKVSASSGKVLCAVIGCKRPARAKGYCAAHYQKYRMLSKTGRLPSDWVEDASPQSVKNLVLPRGRAGAKALAEAKKKSR